MAPSSALNLVYCMPSTGKPRFLQPGRTNGALMRVNSQQNRMALGQSYARESEISDGLPVYLVVESTSICNLKCIMCPYPSMGRKNEHMKMTLYEKLLAEAAGSVEFMWLHLFGEPLLNPNIYKMIDMAEGVGIRTGISTNATRLDEQAASALLDSKLSLLLLCLDGTKPETYERIRVGAKFETVRDNIARFAEMKRARKTPLTATLQMIHMTANEAERQSFEDEWRDKGFEAILYKSFNPWANQDEKLIQIEEKLAPPSSGMCSEPWIGCTILADGTVVPCCNDYSAKIPLGNLRIQSLREIWNGEEMRKLRRRFIGSAPNLAGTICQDCPYPVASVWDAERGSGTFDPITEQLRAYVLTTEKMPPLDPALPHVVDMRIKERTFETISRQRFACEVVITNRSPWTLRSSGDTPVHLSYHWLDANGACVVYDGIRTRIVPDLASGAEGAYAAQILAPNASGRYVLQLSLVQEHVAWLDSWDSDNSDVCVVEVADPKPG